MSTIKGQFFRVLLGGKCVALSKSCSVHVAADLSETTTKDSTGMWKEQECVAKSWDGSVNGLVGEPDSQDTGAVQGLDAILMPGTTVTVEFEQTTGTKNRHGLPGGVKFTGTAIVNDCSAEFGDRADSTFTLQFQGTGALTKTTIPSITGSTELTATTTNQTSTYTASDSSTISVSVPAEATWLTATITGNTLTYKGSANAGAERSAVITLSTTSGASLDVTITQAGA